MLFFQNNLNIRTINLKIFSKKKNLVSVYLVYLLRFVIKLKRLNAYDQQASKPLFKLFSALQSITL